MEFQTILFVFGAILFLVGLIGHIKAKEIEVGSTSKVVRGLSFVIGIVFIILSFIYPFHSDSLDKTAETPGDPGLSIGEGEQAHLPIYNNVEGTADATFTYWEKCQQNDSYYHKLLSEEDAIIGNSDYSNKVRGEANLRKANLIREYIKSEEDIPTKNVDIELVEFFSQLRNLFNQRANYFERIGDVLLSVGDSPDDAIIDLANQRIDAVVYDDERLQLQFNQLNIERELLKDRLLSKYGREFEDRDFSKIPPP